jgi:hypothetical protein
MSQQETRKPIAASVDVGGVLIERLPLQIEAVVEFVFHPRRFRQPFQPSYVPKLEDDITKKSSQSGKLRKIVGFYNQRHVKKEAKELLESLGADAYFINSGRINNEEIASSTREKLTEAGIVGEIIPEENIGLRLHGANSTDESKFLRIQQLEEQGYKVVHVDDNARTVKRLAPHFPNAEFVIVCDLMTGLLFSRKEMEKYSNVKRTFIGSHWLTKTAAKLTSPIFN